MLVYILLIHTATYKISKQANNYQHCIVIQSSLSRIHGPMFKDEKEDCVEVGGVNSHKQSFSLKSLPKREMWDKVLSVIHNACHFKK